MKLRNYIALMKNEAYCNIVGAGDEVWLGLRAALYRAPAMPLLCDNDQVRAVMDLTDKQIGKIYISYYEYGDANNLLGYDCSDGAAPGEQTAKRVNGVVRFFGITHSALQAEDGELVFYNESYLAPLADIMKEHGEQMSFAVRKTAAGQRYIVVKDGMWTVAVIMPMEVDLGDYLERLSKFEALCAAQYEREQNRKDKTED